MLFQFWYRTIQFNIREKRLNCNVEYIWLPFVYHIDVLVETAETADDDGDNDDDDDGGGGGGGDNRSDSDDVDYDLV